MRVPARAVGTVAWGNMPARPRRDLPALSALFVPPSRPDAWYGADGMMSAVRRMWLALWFAIFTGTCCGVSAVAQAIYRSPWYYVFVALDFACVAVLVWAIVVLRRAHEAQRADAEQRETIVRSYIQTQHGRSDRDDL